MKNNISHMLEKAGICGAATMGIGMGFLGFGQTRWSVPGTSMIIPVEFLTLTVGAINSVVADGIHTFINKHIPLGKKTSDKVSFFTNAAIAGGSFFALLHLAGSNVPYQYTFLRAFATGALGEVVGAASYEYLVNNLYI